MNPVCDICSTYYSSDTSDASKCANGPWTPNWVGEQEYCCYCVMTRGDKPGTDACAACKTRLVESQEREAAEKAAAEKAATEKA